MSDKKQVQSKKVSRLRTEYVKVVLPAMMKEHGYTNIMQVPKIERVVVNMRLGDVKDNSKSFNAAVDELAQITGQKPAMSLAKKSISNFKLREGMKIGARVTLRGEAAYYFLDKLITIALPRVRDFRGVAKGFDGRGNFTMGIKEHIVFPEISYDKIEKVRGLDITIVTTANTDEEAESLLTKIGMPFADTVRRVKGKKKVYVAQKKVAKAKSKK